MGGGGEWHKASVSDCLPLAAPIGLSPLLILTFCGPGRVLVVSTEPPDDLYCLTTPGVGCPGDGLLPVPLTMCIRCGASNGQVALSALGSGCACPTAVIAHCPALSVRRFSRSRCSLMFGALPG